MPETIRPTKKQRELLEFIAGFIAENGYSPSYREIMTGLNYNSVATVALHINSLIKRGHLLKRDHSARSLELSSSALDNAPLVNKASSNEEKWLVKKVEQFFKTAENSKTLPNEQLDQLYVLIGALKVLDMDGAVQSFLPRLSSLKVKHFK